MTDLQSLEFYLKEHSIFLSDFWHAGNFDLNIAIEPRPGVESGTWYTATWRTTDGTKRHITAQRWKLVWERVIKQFLSDEVMNEKS